MEMGLAASAKYLQDIRLLPNPRVNGSGNITIWSWACSLPAMPAVGPSLGLQRRGVPIVFRRAKGTRTV